MFTSKSEYDLFCSEEIFFVGVGVFDGGKFFVESALLGCETSVDGHVTLGGCLSIGSKVVSF